MDEHRAGARRESYAAKRRAVILRCPGRRRRPDRVACCSWIKSSWSRASRVRSADTRSPSPCPRTLASGSMSVSAARPCCARNVATAASSAPTGRANVRPGSLRAPGSLGAAPRRPHAQEAREARVVAGQLHRSIHYLSRQYCRLTRRSTGHATPGRVGHLPVRRRKSQAVRARAERNRRGQAESIAVS